MSTITGYDDRPPGLPAGLGPLIARVTAPATPGAAPMEAPGLGIFAPPVAEGQAAEPLPALVALDGAALDEMAELDGVPSMAAITERPMIPLRIPGVPLIVPRADVTLAFGRGKIGKGRMTWALISAVTGDGGDVIVIAGEDKQDEQLAARCRASGAVPGRVWDMTRLPGSSIRFKLSAADPEKQPGHIAHLRAFIERLQAAGRDPRLVVIDPLASMVGWGSMLNVAGARRLIEPLQDLADVTGVAIFCIGHTTKDGAKLAGSAGLEQALRLIYRISVDPVNAAYRVVTVEQANNLPPGMDGLRFTVAETEDGTARVEWLTRAVLDQQRTRWRDRLAEREATAAHAPTALPSGNGRRAAPAAPPRPAGPFAAAWAIRQPGGQPVSHVIPGQWAALEAAQGVCQASARTALEWTPSATRPGTWTASVPAPGGAEVSYAVSSATR